MTHLGVPRLKRRLSINTLTETLEDQELQSISLSRTLNKVENELKEVQEKIISQGKQQDDLEYLITEAKDLIVLTKNRIEENLRMVKKAKEYEAMIEANGRDVVSLENKKLNDKIENSKEEFRKFRIEFSDNVTQIKTRIAKYDYYCEQKSQNPVSQEIC
ncbi:hypothetical protein BCR32DRAFT_271871 [Anaeromyces robustus]|uniref:Uncharacterized protein n=1 Tax=Anaeromyces robustus TaxID=1754192 RepID=A0A1Y1WPP2_9FUNG|nr:hypothetical protein BCR32DRAFT_271871 [Anaeromyces robustus]|eukprot:ORX75493.1 hypothetical protein BCR32DRAFT_271871 [Anaeromyces robustus]